MPATKVDLDGLLDLTVCQELQPLIAAIQDKKRMIFIIGAGISEAANSKDPQTVMAPLKPASSYL
jgi:hypothetical protein